MSILKYITNAQKVAPPSGLYSHAVRVPIRELLFISGQTANDVDGNLLGNGDIEIQTRQVFKNLQNILNSEGTDLKNVIEFTVYIVGNDFVKPFIDVRNDIFKNIYTNGCYPCSTLINISSLGGSDAIIEISATAIIHNMI